jgi:DNA-binding LacI/PurR family transcriptional regulator
MTLRHAIGRLANQGILERRQRVGTFVRAGRSFANIGVLFFHVRRISTSNLPSLTLHTIAKAADEKRRRVHAMLMTSPLPSATQVYEELRSLNVGAVALQGFLDEDRDFIVNLASHLPCVLFNKGLTGVSLPCATSDGFAAARLAADYLAERRRKRVVCGRFVTGHRLHQEFLMTMEAELLRRGMECDRHLWFHASGHEQTPTESQTWIDRVLAHPNRVDAMVLNNRESVMYALERMYALGERPGKERDIVALYGGTGAFSENAAYATVAYDDHAAVDAATDMLIKILNGQLDPASAPLVRIQPALIPPVAQ